MKKVLLVFSMAAVSACGGKNTSSLQANKDSTSSPAERKTLEDGDSKIIIAALKRADVTGVTNPGPHPSTSWKLNSLRCTESTMELVAPGGGGFTIRVIKSCLAETADLEQKIFNGDEAKSLISILQTEGVVSVTSGGAHPSTEWNLKNLRCSESTMELVAAGGGGFTTRVINSCSFEAVLRKLAMSCFSIDRSLPAYKVNVYYPTGRIRGYNISVALNFADHTEVVEKFGIGDVQADGASDLQFDNGHLKSSVVAGNLVGELALKKAGLADDVKSLVCQKQ